MATSALPIQRHDDSSVLALIVCIALIVFFVSFYSKKGEPMNEIVPPTEEELRFMREQRAKAMTKNNSASADKKEAKDEKVTDSEKKEDTGPSSKVPETFSEPSVSLTQATTEKLSVPKENSPQKSNASERPKVVDSSKETTFVNTETQLESKRDESKDEENVDSIDRKPIAPEEQNEEESSVEPNKKHQVAHTMDDNEPKKMKGEKLGSASDISHQSRLLVEREPTAPPPFPSPSVATTTLKDPPPAKKRARKKVSLPQLLADILSAITKLQIVVTSDDGKKYRPRKNSTTTGKILKVSFNEDQKLSTAKIPTLPKTFRDLSNWFARTHATARNGFSPHITSAADDGYDDFQLFLSDLKNELSQEAQSKLKSDQAAVIHDEDDEDDLFSSYAQPIQQAEASSPVVSFLSLLEETPSVVGRPFLDHILSKNSDVASLLLQRALVRLDNPPSLDLISKRATAVSTLVQSPIVIKAWTKRVQHENESTDTGNKSGKELESTSWLTPLLRACANCIPEAGAELPAAPISPYRKALELLHEFPSSIYNRQNKELGLFVKQNQSQMQVARNVAEAVLRKGGKDNLFMWLSHVVQANDAMGSLLRGDLLATNGVASVLSSRGFLLGLGSSVIGICGDSLVDLFAKDNTVFDYRYLIDGRLDVAEEELMLVRNKRRSKSEQAIKFSGGSEFFFLTCSLLRVSIYPSLRIEGAFLRHFSQVFAAVNKAHNDKTGLSPHLLSVSKPVMAALMGWKTFLDDPDFVAKLTKFSILQLQWVLANKDNFESIPEWMCKNPATWLSHVAQSLPQLLIPYQAAATIECATQLLQVGTKANDERALSPVVIDDLVKIIAGFVNAGVNRAKQKQRRRPGDFDVDRDASLYLSFDQNDLGVTVFTNELVSKELCPTLMQTFGAVDVVEGLDVDREHGFDKFSAKGRIAELFLRLWSHPNGECRASVGRMDDGLIAQFAKEIEIATGVLFDFSCNRMADMCNGSKQRIQSHRDKAFLVGQGRSVSSELYYARLWILLLCKISEEPKIRRILGSSSLATDLASLMIHFVDILTDPDGGIHPNLDFAHERSSELASRPDMTATERQKHAAEIAKARYISRVVYGLDVASLAHQFMALLSCWHKQSRDGEGRSSILMAFAAHDDYEEARYRNILRRLVAEKHSLIGNEGDCAETIFEHDGYVDVSAWELKYKESLDKSPETENQIRTSKKDQMTRGQIQVLASIADISSFLDDAEACKTQAAQLHDSVSSLSAEELNTATEAMFTGANEATFETYSDKLSDWLVSSEEFESPQNDHKFAHYYDGTARTRNVACSGKTMVKEARRCHKNLPVPHPNSAAFCCFAEERMDLCRSCISGPVDTPYAHGIFVFEVFFPANYPTIPPLVTFMTTGGGQTRFNPNLYSDGKVCLSLLGTFHAQDESQKWNPGYSSLAQILLSIQTQLLVEEPYFNEPGNEARQGTPVGRESSTRYNIILQLATLRHAILAPLKQPPVGLEEICDRHFSLCRRRIVVQARRWMLEAKSAKSTLFPRFERAYVELVTILTAKYGNELPSLPPCEADVKALKKMGALLKGLANPDPDEQKQRATPRELQRVRIEVGATGTVRGQQRQVRTARVQRVPSQEMSEVSLAAALMTAASLLEDNPWANSRAAVQKSGNETPDTDDELYD